jgi:hypothetical protein
MAPSAICDFPVFCTAAGLRCFSLARHALATALTVIGARRGSRVLLPEYICRDVLAPLYMAGVVPVWYPVSASLQPAADPADWPVADIALMVDYFGFPQDLAPFQAYVNRTGAVLIEDNAHGFLSRDAAGNWLGRRGQLGLLSMRKTLLLPDGAALTVDDASFAERLPPQLPFVGAGIMPAQVFKARLRRLPFVGSLLARLATASARGMRWLRTGRVLPASNPKSEQCIDAAAEPWAGLPLALAKTDIAAEVRRRRQLYAEFAVLSERHDIRPVFAHLPDGCAPYGFVFRAAERGIAAAKRMAARLGLDLVPWPDLPETVAVRAPGHYRDVWVVNFLS